MGRSKVTVTIRGSVRKAAAKIVIRDGTPRSGDDSLCASCAHAERLHIEGQEPFHVCHFFNKSVRRKVLSCTAYLDRAAKTWRTYIDDAWVMVRDKKGNPRFFNPVQARRLEQEGKIPDTQDAIADSGVTIN